MRPLYPLRTCQGTESSRYFSSEEQKELFPVKRNVIQETIVSILWNRLLLVLGIQETEKIFPLKYQQQQKLENLISRDPAGFGNIRFSEEISNLEFFYCIRKLILGMFILLHLVYHKISTSSLVFVWCGNLIIPKIRCYFYVKAPIKCIFYQINQASARIILVGKLSYEINYFFGD